MFNEYPNTNFHELNLDWFLSEFNSLLKKYNLVLDQELHDFIIKHFNDIFGDVSYDSDNERLILEVNHALYADGEHIYRSDDEVMEISEDVKM